MTRLIDLGCVSEETKGAFFHSSQLDPTGVKIEEGGVKYTTAPPELNPDGVRNPDPE